MPEKSEKEREQRQMGQKEKADSKHNVHNLALPLPVILTLRLTVNNQLPFVNTKISMLNVKQ